MDDIVLMGHGGGGRLTKELIDRIIARELGNPILNEMDDAACLTVQEPYLALTTDSYVIDPIFFPGGDIGKLAVCGTINDLAMQGAEPRYMSMALILEEGLPLKDLERVVRSMKNVLMETGVQVVTGDTKVVGAMRRATNNAGTSSPGGLFVNTTGLGIRRPGVNVSVANARPGDAVIVSGTIGDHGIAIMNAREGLKLESSLISDAAPLWGMIGPLLDAVPTVHCLRDPTRGGLAAALCDIAERSRHGIRIREAALPIKNEVRGACGILGLEPLNVPNEGKAVVVCFAADAARALSVLRSHPLGRDACVIGEVCEEPKGMVLLKTRVGSERIVDIPTGEDLPRIC